MSEIPKADDISEKLEKYLRGRQHNFVLSRLFIDSFECDVFSVSQSGYTNEFEIKRTISDYQNDFKKKDAWKNENKIESVNAGKRTNKFFYVIPEEWTIDIPKQFGIYTYKHENGEVIWVAKKREGKLLHSTNYQNDLSVWKNIALKSYYRFMDARLKLHIYKSQRTSQFINPQIPAVLQ